MSLTDRFLHSYTELEESEAKRLSRAPVDQYTVEIKPPRDSDIPTTLNRFVRNIMEIQSKWLGLKNASPISAFEVRRPTVDTVRFQFAVPTKRLERKVRTHLIEEVPGIGFTQGVSGLPVAEADTIGGGVLTVGREDYHPLRTEFDRPPLNSVATALHRDAMRDTRFVIQILFQPIAGHPFRRWRWSRRAYKQIGYLRKEKPDIVPWHDRPATQQERKQADRIEEKARNPRLSISIRLLIIGAGEHTRSRVKELAGAFHAFENSISNQYLDTVTITPLFQSRLVEFADSVRQRELDGWSLTFQASVPELAALVSIPDRQQRNIQYAQP